MPLPALYRLLGTPKPLPDQPHAPVPPSAMAFRPNWPIRIFRFLHTNLCPARRPSHGEEVGKHWLFFMQHHRVSGGVTSSFFGQFMGFISQPL